jgi:alpha-glucosidase
MSGYEWWQRGIVYQIYPLSFQDSDADGKGDLRGIRSRLDYLVSLGIDAIWISPFYPSPMADFGYDISDYCAVAPTFGTLGEFDALVSEAHAKGLRIILDFVPNHTSCEHPWFRESRASRNSARRDWYLWRDPAPDGGPPNNWLSNFGGSAWELDPATGQYYYHAFLKEQPDLNWRNPAVRAAMYDVLRFWLERGVDGFRVDVLWCLVKDAAFRDNPPNPGYREGEPSSGRLLARYSVDQPELFEILHEMRAVVDAYPERVLIGEIYLPIERLVAYYGDETRKGVHLPFNFQLIQTPWSAREIVRVVSEYEQRVPSGRWPNWVLGNHDKPRIASRVGLAQARVAAMLLLTFRGTPTIYYGDEIGMEDVPLAPEQMRDGWEKSEPGVGLSRDPQRTPMQWDGSEYAGFSTVPPWLPLGPDHATRNVAVQAADPGSILTLHRRLIALRRKRAALSLGSKALLSTPDGAIAFERRFGDERLLVGLNLSHDPLEIPVEGEARVLVSTHLDRAGETMQGRVRLRADEGLVLEPTPASPDPA